LEGTGEGLKTGSFHVEEPAAAAVVSRTPMQYFSPDFFSTEAS